MVHWGKEILRKLQRQGSSVQISTKNPNAIQLSKIHVAPVGHREAVYRENAW
jgi:cell division septation protein DedD